MKLARFDKNRIGVVRDETIVDVTDIVDPNPGAWPPVAMNRLIAEFAEYRGKLERAVTRKGFDSFCPVGPWIVTEDEIGDAAHSLQGRLWINGELKQDANTRDLVLDIPGMIEMAASVMTLFPGDIIAAGTPAGVGPMRH